MDGLLPIWYPEMEDSVEQLGTYSFWINCFQERCGINIDRKGQVCIDVNTPEGYVKGPTMAERKRTSQANKQWQSESDWAMQRSLRALPVKKKEKSDSGKRSTTVENDEPDPIISEGLDLDLDGDELPDCWGTEDIVEQVDHANVEPPKDPLNQSYYNNIM